MLIATLVAIGIVTMPREAVTNFFILLILYNYYECVPSVKKFLSKYCTYR